MLAALLTVVAVAPPFPSDLVEFQPGTAADFPLDTVPWAKAIRERGSVVELPDGLLRLYFTGYDGTRSGIKRVGVAESVDRGRSWTPSDRPVTPERLWCEDPYVFLAGRQFHMFAEGPGDVPHRLSSEDGLQWESHGPITIRDERGDPIAPPAGTPVVIRHLDRWHLLYERRDAGIWLATSIDLQDWKNVSDDPVFRPSDSGFDARMIAFNQVVRRDGRFYAYYHGTDSPQRPREWACGVAVSDDLRNWKRYAGNPITDPRHNLSSPWLISADAGPTLLTTHGGVRTHRPLSAASVQADAE